VVSGLEVLCFLSHLSPLQNQSHITTIISTIHCMLQGAVFADVLIVYFAVGFVICSFFFLLVLSEAVQGFINAWIDEYFVDWNGSVMKP
jgi:hypothetical protein